MCPACLAAVLVALGGSAVGVVALVWLRRRRPAEKEPPSATFKEWIASVVAYKEAEAAQAGASSSNVPADARSRMGPNPVPTLRRIAMGGERLEFFS